MDQVAAQGRTTWNPDKFRLRRLVERLIEMGEVEIHDEPVALSEMSPMIEATTKALLFRKAGPEEHEGVGAVSASRRRLAAAFGVGEDKMREEYMRRMANPQKPFEVPSGEAPVHEVVLTGDQIDLTKLPFHVQHEYDGAPYISSGIDFTIDPVTKRSNVGCRRLMLRGKDKCGFNLTAPSDLRQIYLGGVARGLRRLQHRAGAVGQRARPGPVPPLAAGEFGEGLVNPFAGRLERNARVLPGLDQGPVQRRQKDLRAARPLEMLLDLREVIEIVQRRRPILHSRRCGGGAGPAWMRSGRGRALAAGLLTGAGDGRGPGPAAGGASGVPKSRG